MKIATWNCNMAFRKKAEFILAVKPDILVVPECEHPGKNLFSAGTAKATDALWFGRNQNKGLGIFSFCDFKFTVLDCHNPRLRMVIPIQVSNDRYQFTLFAIWANNPDDKDGRYIEQVGKALDHYDQYLLSEKVILIG